MACHKCLCFCAHLANRQIRERACGARWHSNTASDSTTAATVPGGPCYLASVRYPLCKKYTPRTNSACRCEDLSENFTPRTDCRHGDNRSKMTISSISGLVWLLAMITDVFVMRQMWHGACWQPRHVCHLGPTTHCPSGVDVTPLMRAWMRQVVLEAASFTADKKDCRYCSADC